MEYYRVYILSLHSKQAPTFHVSTAPPMMFEKPWVILNLLAHQESAEIKDGACTFSDVSGMP